MARVAGPLKRHAYGGNRTCRKARKSSFLTVSSRSGLSSLIPSTSVF